MEEDMNDKIIPMLPNKIYDIYVFGIQEGINNNMFEMLEIHLNSKNLIRLDIPNKDTQIHDRGDGVGLLKTKYTGIAIFVNKFKLNVISFKKACSIRAGFMEGSKGGVCVLLKVYSSTICFVCTHMSCNTQVLYNV